MTRYEREQRAPEPDAVVSAAGPWGRWQARQAVLLALLKLPIAWFQLSITFLAPPQAHWCQDPPHQDSPLAVDQCHAYDVNSSRAADCRGWEYNRTIFHETIISEWDLVCSRGQLSNVAQMVFMFGVLLGNVFFGAASDRWGRRRPLVIAILVQGLSGLGTAFVPCLSGFMLLRFLVALATGGTMVISFVICMEIVGGPWRTVIPILYQIPFGVGVAVMAGAAHLFRHWRDFQLALALCTVPFASYYWLIPESPRWLLAVGRDQEALTVLEDAARTNGMDVDQVKAALLKHRMGRQSGPPPRAGLVSLLRTPRMRRMSLCLFFTWFAVGLSFFGFSQFLAQIGGNVFINVALSGLTSIPGPVLCAYLVRCFGRRNTILGSLFASACASLLIMAVPLGVFSGDWPRSVLASLAGLGMSITFPALYLYSGELLPTVVRNVGLGASSMFARIGSMAAPFVLSLGAFGDFIPLITLGGLMPLIGAMLILPLPETRGCVLPETVEDGEHFCRRRAKEDMQNANYVQVPLKDASMFETAS